MPERAVKYSNVFDCRSPGYVVASGRWGFVGRKKGQSRGSANGRSRFKPELELQIIVGSEVQSSGER